MKIAIPCEAGMVYQHFGRAAAFKLYEIQDGKALSGRIVEANGCGHGALAGLLVRMEVNTLICGGIGAGARHALEDEGIEIYGGVTGDVDEVAEAFASGVLEYDPCARCDHHNAGNSICGSHGCGSHSCQ